jgi:hypothetical protein
LRKAKKRLEIAKNKQKNHLLALGIQAYKDNKARIARLQEVKARNGILAFKDIIPIRKLDKDPITTK